MTGRNLLGIAIVLIGLSALPARLPGESPADKKGPVPPPASKSAARVARSIKRLKTAMGTVPADTAKSESSQTSVHEMIQRLKSLSIPDKPVERGAEIASESPKPTTRPAGSDTTAAPAPKKISREILDQIRKVSPGKVVDPVSVGDAMFNEGELEVAAVFYGLALERKSDNRTRAWVLYQLGNCQVADDPSSALASYGELTAKYPKTLWAELAGMQIRMVRWRIAARPDELLKRIRTGSTYKPAPKKKTTPAAEKSGESAGYTPAGSAARTK